MYAPWKYNGVVVLKQRRIQHQIENMEDTQAETNHRYPDQEAKLDRESHAQQ